MLAQNEAPILKAGSYRLDNVTALKTRDSATHAHKFFWPVRLGIGPSYIFMKPIWKQTLAANLNQLKRTTSNKFLYQIICTTNVSQLFSLIRQETK